MTTFLAAAIEVIGMVAVVAVGSARSWWPALTGAPVRRRSEARHPGPNRGVRIPAILEPRVA
jgi:hypothetical protein